MSSWYSVSMGPMVVKKHKGDIGETVTHSRLEGMEWDNVDAEGVVVLERILVDMIKQLTDAGEAHIVKKKGRTPAA